MAFDANIRDIGKGMSLARIAQVHPETFTATVYILSGLRPGLAVECTIRSMAIHASGNGGVAFFPEIGDEVFIDWNYGATP
jgi:hypothetical protein